MNIKDKQLIDIIIRRITKNTLDPFTPYTLPDLSGVSLTSRLDISKVADILDRITHGTHFTVAFIKRSDSSYRRLNCIAGIKFSSMSGSAPYHTGYRDLFTVFHTGDPLKNDKAGPRNIPMERVLYIEVNPVDGELTHHHTTIYYDPKLPEYLIKLSANEVLQEAKDNGSPMEEVYAIRTRTDMLLKHKGSIDKVMESITKEYKV